MKEFGDLVSLVILEFDLILLNSFFALFLTEYSEGQVFPKVIDSKLKALCSKSTVKRVDLNIGVIVEPNLIALRHQHMIHVEFSFESALIEITVFLSIKKFKIGIIFHKECFIIYHIILKRR